MKSALSLGVLLFTAVPVTGAEPVVSRSAEREQVTLTVYQQDLGLVHERRRLPRVEKDGWLVVGDVSEHLMPESVFVRAGDKRSDLQVREQTYRFDILNPRNLLEAAVGRRVAVVQTNDDTGEERVREGVLLSAQGPVVQTGDLIRPYRADEIAYYELPPGLHPEPVLLLRLGGRADTFAMDYLTHGLSWQADHVVVLPENGGPAEWDVLAGVTNRTGESFTETNLRLVAGEPNLVRAARPVPMATARELKLADSAVADSGTPTAVGEYYVYEVDEPVALADAETRRYTLARFPKAEYDREFVLNDRLEPWQPQTEEARLPVQTVLRVANTKKRGIGQPLPAGTVRFYQRADNGPLVFLGEDRIAHVAVDDAATLQLGNAFDLTATRVQTDWKRLAPDRNGREGVEAAWRITVRNARKEKRTVKVVEQIPGRATILEESQPRAKTAGEQAVWYVEIPPEGYRDLSFRLRLEF